MLPEQWAAFPPVVSNPAFAVNAVSNWTKAEPSEVARRHASLGLNSYARVTSPARRYPDIVNHRQVRGEGEEGEDFMWDKNGSALLF